MLVDKYVRYIQYQIPRLKAGEYQIAATLVAGRNEAPVTYPTQTRGFAVPAPRFKLAGDDLASVFPPNLANGEFNGTLPHAVLAKPVLPWLRTAYSEDDKSIEKPNTPWLAVLTIQSGELPVPQGQQSPIVSMTVADLVPADQEISVAGAAPLSPPVYGTLSSTIVSYPGLEMLDYGESPADPVAVVDLPVALFTRIAPTIADLDFLAHLRETDTYDTVDSKDIFLTRSIVLGNRCATLDKPALVLLVSLEQLSDCLPDSQGNSGRRLAGKTAVRLAVLANWTFTANRGGEDLAALLRGVDADGIWSLRLPANQPPADQVNQALANEAIGLAPPDATALVTNALNAGYVPLDHHLRQAGQTVSWYRGPLLPYGSAPNFDLPSVQWPDALLRYDPQTGMFDASYAAAWQLGQLMALRARGYSVSQYRWKRQVDKKRALAAEHGLLEAKLRAPPPGSGDQAVRSEPLFASLFARRRAVAAPEVPEPVIDFIASLRRLENVPFGYLVPDERMLPPESLRFFTLDPNWVEALVDGAFSVGRTSTQQTTADQKARTALRPSAAAAARLRRRNDRPHLALLKQKPADPAMQTVTGLLMRSQAVRGWPKLQIDGYSTNDDSKAPDVPKLRMQHLSADVLLCLFDGQVAMIAIHEPPEQLHSGVEFQTADLTTTAATTLRAVNGPTPGRQYPQGSPPQTGLAQVPLRGDLLTIRPAPAAVSIQNALNDQFHVGIGPLTANEFALEMVKGVIRVEYYFGAGQK
jgi:hypothetical protein